VRQIISLDEMEKDRGGEGAGIEKGNLAGYVLRFISSVIINSQFFISLLCLVGKCRNEILLLELFPLGETYLLFKTKLPA
jgi:hypothetical protein